MGVTDSDLLLKPGAIDGEKFFSRSPFRSGYFLAITVLALACTASDLFLVYRYWHKLSPPALLTLWMTGCGVIGPWLRALRYHDRVRQFYLQSTLAEVKSDTVLHVALSVAAAAMNDALFFCLTAILLLFVYIGHLLSIG